MVQVWAGREQAVEARADGTIYKRRFQTVSAVKPVVRTAKNRKIFFVAEQSKGGQCGIGHGDGLDWLLIVQRFTLAVRIPIAVSDWPKEIVRGSLAIKKSERRFGDIAKIFFRPALSGYEQRVRQDGICVGQPRFEPLPIWSF